MKILNAFICTLLLFVLSCSHSTSVQEDLDPVGHYGIDVKTTFTNKYTATGLKNGHIAYMRIRGGTWCVDKEIGEDYSFWIENVRSTPVGDSTILQFDLELRGPAELTSGTFIAGRYGYRIAYPNNPDWSKQGTADAAKVAQYVKATLERNLHISRSAANYAAKTFGQPEMKQVIDVLLDAFFSDSKIEQSQVEGALVGAITFSEMRDMIKVYVEK